MRRGEIGARIGVLAAQHAQLALRSDDNTDAMRKAAEEARRKAEQARAEMDNPALREEMQGLAPQQASLGKQQAELGRLRPVPAPNARLSS